MARVAVAVSRPKPAEVQTIDDDVHLAEMMLEGMVDDELLEKAEKKSWQKAQAASFRLGLESAEVEEAAKAKSVPKAAKGAARQTSKPPRAGKAGPRRRGAVHEGGAQRRRRRSHSPKARSSRTRRSRSPRRKHRSRSPGRSRRHRRWVWRGRARWLDPQRKVVLKWCQGCGGEGPCTHLLRFGSLRFGSVGLSWPIARRMRTFVLVQKQVRPEAEVSTKPLKAGRG